MQQGRWKSERSLFRYTENLDADRTAMAEFMKRQLRPFTAPKNED